jgi:hypothetical protein
MGMMSKDIDHGWHEERWDLGEVGPLSYLIYLLYDTYFGRRGTN